MSKYQSCIIRSNNPDNKMVFKCQFRSAHAAKKFFDKYQNYPGYRILNYDIEDESDKSFHLPTISANYGGFVKVVNGLS